MSNRFYSRLAVLALFALALGGIAPSSQATESAQDIHIGMVRTLFTDVPMPIVQLLSAPFSSLVKEFTGFNGKIVTSGDAFDLGRDLNDGKVQFGVFHGFEFGWAQSRYPNLKPLMMAINKSAYLHANLIVRNDSEAACLADFKGKDISLPLRSREHCRLFLERGCADCGAINPDTFFSKIVKSANAETALDDLCAGTIQAVIVDDVGLETYELVKPGCYARLKVLKKSEVFPAGVVVYKEGAVSADTLKHFHDGMIVANKSERGRDMMSLWRLTEFAPLPSNYSETLATILKSYPPPPLVTKL